MLHPVCRWETFRRSAKTFAILMPLAVNPNLTISSLLAGDDHTAFFELKKSNLKNLHVYQDEMITNLAPLMKCLVSVLALVEITCARGRTQQRIVSRSKRL